MESGKSETPWIESEWLKKVSKNTSFQEQNDDDEDDDDDDEPEMSTDLFADPDPLDTFTFQWKTTTATDEEEKYIDITLTGYKAELGQTLNSTGLTLWRASNILCDFMVKHKEVIRSANKVLELGAGLGLCGIVASKLGASLPFYSSGDDNEDDDVLRCYQLIWGENLYLFSEMHGSFDLILGSDIIYVEEILEPLWNTIDLLLSSRDKNANAEFWLAYARRNVSIDLVFAEAEKRGFVWESPEDAEGVYIFRRAPL
ncbi:hypothetical protein ACA910_016184 [Epithemia clementina (nom. ined.)]